MLDVENTDGFLKVQAALADEGYEYQYMMSYAAPIGHRPRRARTALWLNPSNGRMLLVFATDDYWDVFSPLVAGDKVADVIAAIQGDVNEQSADGVVYEPVG